MKIAALTNLYPPAVIGGYELGCCDVMESLSRRGHTVRILTSIGSEVPASSEKNVSRCLPLYSWGNISDTQLYQEETALGPHLVGSFRLIRLLHKFRPDLILVWCVARLPKSILFVLERNFKVGFYVADHWMTKNNRPLFRFLASSGGTVGERVRRAILRYVSGDSFKKLDVSRVVFASRFLKTETLDAGLNVSTAAVIPWGIPLYGASRPRDVHGQMKVVFAGQLMPHKGCHTVISAVASMLESNPYCALSLTIFGSGAGVGAQEYYEYLRKLAAPWISRGIIDFAGQVERIELRRRLAEFDVFVFPSEWAEPFSIALLEAMDAELAVVATPTGGTPELLNEDNSRFFRPGDPQGLSEVLTDLLSDPCKVRLLQEASRQTASNYSLETMVDRLEREFTRWCPNARSHRNAQ